MSDHKFAINDVVFHKKKHWFNSPSVRVYPAISQSNFISKKEASCVGY